MKITKRNITRLDIAEFERIFDEVLSQWQLTNEEVIGFFIANAKVLTIEKIRWFFEMDSSRTFNWEKI
jgi:hypothetical protein